MSHDAPRPVQVLVVESHEPARQFLVDRLAADPQIQVMNAVGDAQGALDVLQRQRPHVVLMGHRMPGLDGFDTTRRIMASHPLPIVVCATSQADEAVFRSLEAGAVACVAMPPQEGADGELANLLQTVKLMSEVKVVRRWASRAAPAARPAPERPTTVCGKGLVGIGASTGGPPVLQTILANLPQDFPMPVLVVQHIAAGFLPGMAEWLRQTSGLKVQIAAYGMQPLPGHVYLAPDNFQMSVGPNGRIVLARPVASEGLCPSVASLFGALAQVCGRQAVGVLLTGMGKDGASELRLLKDRGAVTIVQDRASSVVYGMPGEAVRLDAATHVLPPERIAETLVTIARQRSGS
jgi:two-component system chemotaxis response regulator CheB